MNRYWSKEYSTFRIIVTGFILLIAVGTILLMLPFSTRNEMEVSLLEALFTATSAVCVTGLVVRDTASTWSPFGQAVILSLIQIGGLGVVTVTVAIALFSGKKIGLMQRSTLQDAMSAPQLGGIVRLVFFALRLTTAIEIIGAVLLSIRFIPQFGFFKGIWYGIFHSISAFCNAGFDLMGRGAPFSSLTSYSADVIINMVIMILIIAGGAGFLTWEDILKNRLHIRKYRMQSKVIITVSIVLIVLPAFYFAFSELSTMSASQRIWTSLFQSVTTRTAGFNTIDLRRFSEAGIFIMIILMLIGGSPGSTAGGMKTTTIAVLFSSAIAVFRKREKGILFQRQISSDTIHNASAILQFYLVMFITSALIISRIEHLPLLDCLFETASAIGTVGLTLGITGSLGTISRVILIILMYLGRVGGLTLVFAAVSKSKPGRQLPEEKITVG